MRIIIIGNFTGYNAGDSVILESILNDLNKYYQNATIVIPGTEINIKSKYNSLKISYISTDRKHFAIRFFSVKMIKEMMRADLLVVTAGTVFSRRFNDVNYSFLSTLIPSYKIAKLKNRKMKIVCYNVGIAFDGLWFANKCVKGFLQDASIVSLRHSQDKNMIKDVCPNIMVSLDNVFGYGKPLLLENNQDKIIIGVNLASYAVNNTGVDLETWCLTYLRNLRIEFPNAHIKCIETTKGDYKFVSNLIDMIEDKDIDVIDLTMFEYRQIRHIYSEINLFVGMRMHSLIFALKESIPSIGLTYDDKVRKLFCDLGLEKFVYAINGNAIGESIDALKKMREDEDLRNYIYCRMIKAYDTVSSNNMNIWRDMIPNV